MADIYSQLAKKNQAQLDKILKRSAEITEKQARLQRTLGALDEADKIYETLFSEDTAALMSRLNESLTLGELVGDTR